MSANHPDAADSLGANPDVIVPSTLEVVESFFQEELSQSLISKVRGMPEDQEHELHERIIDRGGLINELLDGRGEVASSRKSQRGGRHEHVFIHDELFFDAGVTTDIANIGALKHAVLYCDHILVRDPLMESDQLADGLQQLLPLAELVRSGVVTLGSEDHLEQMSLYRDLVAGDYRPLEKTDPYVAWLMYNEHPKLGRSIRQMAQTVDWFMGFGDVADFGDELIDELLAVYPHRVSADQLRRILLFGHQIRRQDLTPVTSNHVVAHHLAQSTRILLDGAPELSTRSTGIPNVGPAISYGIPPLNDVSFANHVQLRRDEEVFAEIRSSLGKLTDQCAMFGTPESLQAYKAVLRNCSQDVLRPSLERLARMQRRAKIKFVASRVALKAMSFGVDGIVELLVEGVDMAGEPILGKRAARRHHNAKLANKILMSIMPV